MNDCVDFVCFGLIVCLCNLNAGAKVLQILETTKRLHTKKRCNLAVTPLFSIQFNDSLRNHSLNHNLLAINDVEALQAIETCRLAANQLTIECVNINRLAAYSNLADAGNNVNSS